MKNKKPLIAINFKTYESASGKEAVELAKVCDVTAKETDANVIVCVQASDIHFVQSEVSIPVYAQHIDGVDFGSHTGKILADSVKENGGSGTLLNHSEDQYEAAALVQAHEHAKAEELITIICAGTIERAIEVAKLNPDFVAFEPPELIGGDISVTTKPELITDVVKQIRSINSECGILVGAGVKVAEDVRVALKLGCAGVLLASGITKSANPKDDLLQLIEGTQNE